MCGGYTSKNWDGSRKFIDDIDAFVFNMTQKYITNNSQKAIWTNSYGFEFGSNILRITPLIGFNQHN